MEEYQIISRDKTYKTHDGRRVRIYSVDDNNGFAAVHGAYETHLSTAKNGSDFTPDGWFINGTSITSPNLNLVEIKDNE